VVVSDVNDAGGEETVALIAAAGGTAVYQRCNVADAGEVKALVARAVAEYGRLDFAHNNAGINNMGCGRISGRCRVGPGHRRSTCRA
jgi:NAD(P)-dependent dehydrogenase (short-subunit alcohol dehydrogenase family)